VKLALLMALGVSAIGVGCKAKGESTHAQGPTAIPVKVEIAREMPVNETSEYVATLKSRDSAVIMPQVEGQITQIYVRSGERVGHGTPLMQIDPAKQQATLNSQQNNRAAQEANLRWAQQQYQRTSGLAAAGVVSKQELDQAKSALDTAKAQVESLDAQVKEQQVQLRYYKVESPWTGVVGDIPVHVGDRVTTSTLLTTVDKPGGLEAYIYIPIERSGQLRMNLPVEIVDGEGKTIAKSRISFVSPQVDNTTQTVLVKARIESKENLRPAQFIRARMIWGTQHSPVIPVLAVTRIGGQYFAFIAEQDKNGYVARQRPLKVGQMNGNNYVVLDGLKPGEKVVISGTQFLVDGAPVAPQG